MTTSHHARSDHARSDHIGHNRDALRLLAIEAAELARRIDATAHSTLRNESDLQVLRNFAALAPFANPELLPPFRRFVRSATPRSEEAS